MLGRGARLVVAAAILATACSGEGGEAPAAVESSGAATTSTAPAQPAAPPSPTTSTLAPATTTTVSPFARPQWLGTRPLPLRPDEHGEVQPTPAELVDRRLETIDYLPPPPDEAFAWTISGVPAEVAARSSWVPECPVTLDELAHVTVSHFGFDGEFHTGELLVNAAVAEDAVEVFRRLHESRFPIEQMRVIRREEIDAPPTGDWNDTTSFVCRPAVGSSGWSQHAYGLAIDINPFHNPYLKDDLVLPELASTYTDRTAIKPGMIESGDIVTEAFADIGFGWGGNWSSLKDWMHFSQSGG